MTGSVVFRLVYPLFANVCFAIGLRLRYILCTVSTRAYIRTHVTRKKIEFRPATGVTLHLKGSRVTLRQCDMYYNIIHCARILNFLLYYIMK